MLTWRATRDLQARKKAEAAKDLRYSTTALYSASSIRVEAQISPGPGCVLRRLEDQNSTRVQVYLSAEPILTQTFAMGLLR